MKQTLEAVTLTREDWAEIYYALDTKLRLIENGDYGACEHAESGADCPEQCDEKWMGDLQRIMNKIGDDGITAHARGVVGS